MFNCLNVYTTGTSSKPPVNSMGLNSRERCLRFCSIVGSHLLMAQTSFRWCYGNLSAYMDFYFRFACYPYCEEEASKWILGLRVVISCSGAYLSKVLADKFGHKWAGICGAMFLNGALFASAWTVQTSVAWTVVLLGAVQGLG